jgi:hypothetical protein
LDTCIPVEAIVAAPNDRQLASLHAAEYTACVLLAMSIRLKYARTPLGVVARAKSLTGEPVTFNVSLEHDPASLHMLTAVPAGTMSLRKTRSPLAVFSTCGETPFMPSETESSFNSHSTTALADATGTATTRSRATGNVLK